MVHGESAEVYRCEEEDGRRCEEGEGVSVKKAIECVESEEARTNMDVWSFADWCVTLRPPRLGKLDSSSRGAGPGPPGGLGYRS